MSLRKPADQRKSEIVATMLRLADELGPDRLTTQTVAATVGLTQPAIFRHFPTKQDLWLAVAEMIEDRLTSAWDQALSASSDPLVRIRALVQGQLQQIEAMPAIPAILFSRELQVENEDLRHAVRRLITNPDGAAHQRDRCRSECRSDHAHASRQGGGLAVDLARAGVGNPLDLGKTQFFPVGRGPYPA